MTYRMVIQNHQLKNTMFNSPLLDIAIGLVFIFLLYSLLVTSVNEAVATFFSLRAKMLKTAIVSGMLSDTSDDNRWVSLAKGVSSFFVHLLHLEKKPAKKVQKIGDYFFEHPLIKNYGSSRFYPLPSYIPTTNFSTVLLDVLKQDFDSKLDEIVKIKSSTPSDADVLTDLTHAVDATKIRELLEYYGAYYLKHKKDEPVPTSFIIDRDTWQILQMHLHNCSYNLEKFEQKIEIWYDDSMKRVSGWYKRQTQLILFLLGFLVAIVFNVDTIEIAGKLSTDKDARDKLVQIATKAVDQYKDDPRIKKVVITNGIELLATDSTSRAFNTAVFNEYQAKAEKVKILLNGDVNNTKEILASGWGNYGDGKTSRAKIVFVLSNTFSSASKILGFMILAFAISLGSPFWFDLLNKLVNLRGSGKKEEDRSSNPISKTTLASAPLTLVVNPVNPDGQP